MAKVPTVESPGQLCSGFEPAELRVTSASEEKNLEAEVDGYHLTWTPDSLIVSPVGVLTSCKALIKGGENATPSVHWLAGTHQVLLQSQDEKSQRLTLLDLKSCAKIWESAALDSAEIENKTLKLKNTCAPCNEKMLSVVSCDCVRTEVWKLSGCQLKKDFWAAKRAILEEISHAFFKVGKQMIQTKVKNSDQSHDESLALPESVQE